MLSPAFGYFFANGTSFASLVGNRNEVVLSTISRKLSSLFKSHP